MATCHSCGSDLTGPYCNTCGTKAQPEMAPHKPRKEPPRSEASRRETVPARGARQESAMAPQNVWRYTAMGLISVLIFGAGMIAGFYLGTGSTISADPSAVASFDLSGQPPISIAGMYMDEGVDFMSQGNRTAAANSLRKAVTFYNEALAEEPDNLYARTYLGLTQYYLGDSTKALTELRGVLQQDPNYLWAIFNLAWIYESGENPTEAILMYKKYLTAAPQEMEDRAKYSEQYDLIERQIKASETALANLEGGTAK